MLPRQLRTKASRPRGGAPGAAAIGLLLVFCLAAGPARAQRTVTFPPAVSPPPPPHRQPPRTLAGGEEVELYGENGPTMRKTQERKPPPPTNLTIMFKVQYGEELRYVWPDGRVQVFPQWESFRNDGSRLVSLVNERLADGNNYQYAVKPLSSPGFDPVDIPLLYMTGDYAFTLTDSEVENLRRYLVDGGTIIFNAARGRDEFSRAVATEMQRVFPRKSLMRLPPDHPVFHSRYRIHDQLVMAGGVRFSQAPEVYAIDIGTRAAAILIPGGMGTAWSGESYHPQGVHVVGESAVRLGVNLVAYVLANTEYSRFLAQDFYRYQGTSRPGDVFRFALVSYRGAWDVHPGIQNSLLQGLRENTGIDVDYNPHVVNLDSPDTGHFPLLFMTGHYDFRLTAEERRGLVRYLERGGTLVAAAAAGLKPFDVAFRREIRRAFPGQDLVRLPPSHPVFQGGWNPLERVEYTEAALRDDPTLEYPEFYGLYLAGRLAVIYTPYDFLSGVNLEPNPYVRGVTPEDALRLAINVITHQLSH